MIPRRPSGPLCRRRRAWGVGIALALLCGVALPCGAGEVPKKPEKPKPEETYAGVPLPVTFVRHWLVCGPFPNDRDKDFLGGEAAAAPDRGDRVVARAAPGDGAGALRWQAWRSPGDLLDMKHLFGKGTGCAYAFLHVRVTRRRDLFLTVGADDGVKAWVDGKPVLDRPGKGDAVRADADRVRVRLNEGWHRVLFKVDSLGDTWGLVARFAVEDRQKRLRTAGDLYYTLSLRTSEETVGVRAPTLEEIYAGYRPPFIDWNWVSRGGRLPLSLQPYFFNMTYVDHDWRVDGIVKKGLELEERREWRSAMKLYQAIVDKFTDDMWRLTERGIFVPSALYAQRRLLAFPERELAYYRTLKDAEAKLLFERARRHSSLPDYAEVAERYLATSWGDDALFALGNAALDEGCFELARYYFERIRKYHRFSEIDRGALLPRLADCYKKLGDEEAFRRVKGETAKLTSRDEKTKAYLSVLDRYRKRTPPFFEQRRNPDHVSMSDYTLFPRPTTKLSSREFIWSVPLPFSKRDKISFLQPWVVGNRLLYRYKNTIVCRSLLTGVEKWSFVPAGHIDWFDREWATSQHTPRVRVHFYPDQDLLVHDGLVFSSVVKNGPSLAVLDMLTGQLQWAAGPMAAMDERDLHTRYLCAPAAGQNCVYAPYVYDDMEGDTHLSSEAGIVCFESRTGKVLWKRRLAQLTPRKFTISKFGRKIRIYSSPPTVAGGVIYHTTNTGLVAALDALSGRVRWITRYPHGQKIHDTEEPVKYLWANRPPIVKDGRVYVTPVDGNQLLCLDAATGKVLWGQNTYRESFTFDHRAYWPCRGLIGVTSGGDLVVQTANRIVLVDDETGKSVWSYQAVSPHKDPPNCPIRSGKRPCVQTCDTSRPTLTEDDWVLFGGMSGWHTLNFNQSAVSLRERARVAERWFFGAEYLSDSEKGVKAREPLTNAEDAFRIANRMAVRRYGTTFEIECAPRRLSVNYDLPAVQTVAAKDTSPQGLFGLGELFIVAGREREAIGLLERARKGLALEEARFRAEINQQLFRLYEAQAQASMQLGELADVEKYCFRMATACTTAADEIKVLLGMAEIFERGKQHGRAARCLAAAIKHYGPVRYGLPSLLLAEQEVLKAKGHELIANLVANAPKEFFDGEAKHALACMDLSLENYFSIISPVDADMRVETGQFASRWLQRLLREAPADQARKFNAEAGAAFDKQGDAAGREDEAALAQLIREYPSTKAAQAALDRMIARARAQPEPERRIRLWRLFDLGRTNGLATPAPLAALCEVRVEREPAAALAPSYGSATHELPADANTLLCLLERRGERKGGEGLLFVGSRSKRAHGNKFGLLCWDAAAEEKRWGVSEIRLKGKGNEVGFEECFVHGGKVVVHGRFDVLSFGLADGKEAWRFRVPFNFEIEQAASVEDLIILCGHDRTLALHHASGQIVWEAPEMGAPYCEPFLRDNVLVTVRVNPSGVSFRNLGTGRLLAHQDLPRLLMTREHPVLKRAGKRVPYSFDGESLLLTDGWDYVVVDTAKRKVKWQKRIENVDRFSPLPLPFRLWVSGEEILCLKRQYDTHAAEMFNTETGVHLWTKLEERKEGPIYSAAFDGKTVYGVHHEPDLKTVTLLGIDRRSGKRVLRWKKVGYEEPEVFLDGEMHGRHLVARTKDKQSYELLLFNVDTKKLTGAVKVKGFGDFGNYGEVSFVVQDRHLAILSGAKLTVMRPK